MHLKSKTSNFLSLIIICIVFGIFCACYKFNARKFSPNIEYTYDSEDYDNQITDEVASFDTTVSLSSSTANPSSSASSTSSYSHSGHFDDGYEHGLEDGEDDADHSRYNARNRRAGDYDRGYQYGYEETEEDDEWEDDGGDPFDE